MRSVEVEVTSLGSWCRLKYDRLKAPVRSWAVPWSDWSKAHSIPVNTPAGPQEGMKQEVIWQRWEREE